MGGRDRRVPGSSEFAAIRGRNGGIAKGSFLRTRRKVSGNSRGFPLYTCMVASEHVCA